MNGSKARAIRNINRRYCKGDNDLYRKMNTYIKRLYSRGKMKIKNKKEIQNEEKLQRMRKYND